MNDKPKRRWFQFSIRSMLIAVTVCAVVVWTGMVWPRAQAQKRLVRWLSEEKDFHGNPENKITYDFQRAGQNEPRFAPTWLVDLIGVDYFADVVVLDKRTSNHGSREEAIAEVAQLGDLSRLEDLSLYALSIRDCDLSLLNRHANLRILRLSFTDITGTGLKDALFRQRLRVLSLHGCPVTDEGLEVIGTFENLEELHLAIGNGGLYKSQFSHQGLAHLSRLTRLKKMNLIGLEITDAELAAIANLRSLEELTIDSDFLFQEVTGERVAGLRALTNLRLLSLWYGFEIAIPDGKIEQVVAAICEAHDGRSDTTRNGRGQFHVLVKLEERVQALQAGKLTEKSAP